MNWRPRPVEPPKPPSIFDAVDQRWAEFDRKWRQIDAQNESRYDPELRKWLFLNDYTQLRMREDGFYARFMQQGAA